MAISGLTAESNAVSSGDLATAGGLVLVKTQSFSASSAVNVDSCFTASYENYRVVISNTSSSTAVVHTMRLRASAADNSTSSYNYAHNYSQTSLAATNANASSSWTLNTNLTLSKWAWVFDFFGPQAASETYQTFSGTANGNTWLSGAGSFTASTQFDGFSLIPSTGTITGTLRVYGYKNS